MFHKTAGAVVVVLIVSALRADALDPRKAIAEYSHITWNQREGLPWGPIYALTQTPDGYLWLPSAAGLLRFDGQRFTRWQPLPGESIPNAYATALHTARDGSLWIGFIDGRISRIRNGHIVNYAAQDGLVSRRVRSILDTPNGEMWVWYEPVGLSTFRDGVWQQIRDDDGSEIPVKYLFQDGRHRVWICAGDVAVWRPEERRFVTVAAAWTNESWTREWCSLSEDAQGRIIGLASGGAIRIAEGAPTDRYDGVRGLPRPRLMHRDRQGNLWIPTSGGGLYRIRNTDGPGAAPVEHFGKAEGLSSDAVLSFFEDLDGNLWVGTSNGLNCFRESKLRSITTLRRRTSVLATSVTATRDGSIWVGTSAGLTRFEEDGDRTIERETVLPDQLVRSLRYDNTDHALVGRHVTGIGRARGRRKVGATFTVRSQPYRSAGDRTAGSGAALVRRFGARPGAMDPGRTTSSVEVGPSASGFAAVADRSGGVWVGYDDGHVLRLSAAGRHVYSSSEGLSGAPVRTIYEDRAGKVWVGTDRGLSRFDGGSLHHPDSSPRASGRLRERDHRRPRRCILARHQRRHRSHRSARIREGHADGTHRIEHTLYNAADGLRGMPAHAGNPGAARTRDGRLWFLTQNGIAIVDPALKREKRRAPLVHIEAIGANDQPMDLSAPLRLPARTRNITIEYTAPDLSAPEEVRFRYRLEGLEDDWRDVGGRRQAFYNNLPPGGYRFRVIASNGDGVWNEAGAITEFTVLPAFYQTRWFEAFCVCVVLLSGWGVHRARLWQIARRLRAQFELRVAERARIAQELHDTLIQDLAALSLQAEIVDDQLPEEPDAAKQTLATLRTRMHGVVSHGRREMTALHEGVTGSDDLADALSRAAQEFRRPNGPSFHIVVQGHPRLLHPLVGEEVYRIAREAIGNAFRHAASQHIEVEVSFASDELRVRIHDNGCGISDDVVQAGRPHHFGLQGMRERAKHIGATLRVWSRVDVGTEVDVIVPGRSAFQRLPDVDSPHLGRRFTACFTQVSCEPSGPPAQQA